MNKLHAMLLVALAGYLFGPEVGQAISTALGGVGMVSKEAVMLAAVAWTLPGPDEVIKKLKGIVDKKKGKEE